VHFEFHHASVWQRPFDNRIVLREAFHSIAQIGLPRIASVFTVAEDAQPDLVLARQSLEDGPIFSVAERVSGKPSQPIFTSRPPELVGPREAADLICTILLHRPRKPTGHPVFRLTPDGAFVKTRVAYQRGPGGLGYGGGELLDERAWRAVRTRRVMWHADIDMTNPEQSHLEDDDHLDDADKRAAREQGRTAAPSEPTLRAALLAVGLGLLWAVLSSGRRRRPTDLW
jgi:hypothetical protein